VAVRRAGNSDQAQKILLLTHKTRRGEPIESGLARFGTVDWLFREYKSSKAYTEKVSLRSEIVPPSRSSIEPSLQLGSPENGHNAEGARRF
jgi:hypothetical protein